MTDNPIAEVIAEKIYDGMPYDEPTDTKPPWLPHGNSLKQDEARERARTILAALEAAGFKVLHKNATEDQIAAMKAALDLGPYYKTAFLRAWLAAPTTYTPEQSDDTSETS